MPESHWALGGAGISPSSQREVSGAPERGGSMISFSHCGATNGLDMGEWEVRTAAVRLLHDRGEL